MCRVSKHLPSWTLLSQHSCVSNVNTRKSVWGGIGWSHQSGETLTTIKRTGDNCSDELCRPPSRGLLNCFTLLMKWLLPCQLRLHQNTVTSLKVFYDTDRMKHTSSSSSRLRRPWGRGIHWTFCSLSQKKPFSIRKGKKCKKYKRCLSCFATFSKILIQYFPGAESQGCA